MDDFNLTNNSCIDDDQFTDTEKKILGISGAVASSISIVMCAVVIFLMIIFKKYEFATQRLILYFNISVFLNTINQLIQRSSYNTVDDNMTFCTAVAIFSQFSSLCEVLSISCAMFEFILRIIFNKEGGYLEILYVIIIFAVSAVASWIPFFFDAYGHSFSYCSIVVNKNCTSFQDGLILEAVIWWVPLYGSLIFAVLFYPILFFANKRNKLNYTAIIEVNKNATSEKTLKEIGYIKWLPLLIIILNLFNIATYIYNFLRPTQTIPTLWIISAVINGLQGGVIAAYISLDPNTVKRITVQEISSAIRNSVVNNHEVTDYPAVHERADSLENTIAKDRTDTQK